MSYPPGGYFPSTPPPGWPSDRPWPPWGGGSGGNPPAGGSGGLPTHHTYPPAHQEEKLQLLSAGIGQPVPLAYGRHLVGGNAIFDHEITSGADKGKTIRFLALGEGRWNAIKTLWVNGLVVDHTDTAIVHFHPGLDGETGSEAAPGTPNQKICSLWPSTFADKFTFSRTAYLALKLTPDPTAPDAGYVIIGDYETTRVRIFDSNGTETSFAYSANPAWIALDLLIRRKIRPRALMDAALTAGEKAKIDFPAYVDWGADCDADIGGGIKRWEAHISFVDETDLKRALDTVLTLGRAYMLELNGKFSPRHDEARASVFTVTADILAGSPGSTGASLSFSRKNLREVPNQYVSKFRDLESGKGAGTIATTGTAVTGTGTSFTKQFRRLDAARLDDGAQAGEVRVVDLISSDSAMTLASAFSANQSGRKYSNPGADFAPRTKYTDDEARQDELGRIISTELDFGVNTLERIERLLVYTRKRAGLERGGSMRLLAASGAIDLLPGDVLSGFDTLELDPSNLRDFEVVEAKLEDDLSMTLECQEYDSAIFSDTAGAQQGITLSFPDAYDGQIPAGHLSYRPLSNPLTATDAGTTATINIAAFTMRVAGKDIPVDSGSITALSFTTLYYVYYDDRHLLGRAVTYAATTTKENALDRPDRFFVGSIVTPVDSGPDSFGNDDGGAGSQVGQTHTLGLTGELLNEQVGTGTISNPAYAHDENITTYATLQAIGNGTPPNHAKIKRGVPGAGYRMAYRSLKLKVRTAVTSNTVGGVIVVVSLQKTVPGGGTTTIYNLYAGETRALQTDSIELPLNIRVEDVNVIFTAQASGSASGTVVATFYDAWLEATY